MIDEQKMVKSPSPAATSYVPLAYNRFIYYSVPLLWGAMIALLILNLAMLFTLNRVRVGTIEALSQVEIALGNLANTKLTYDIEVDEVVPVEADIPFSYNANVPVDLVILIDQSLEVPAKAPTGEGIVLEVPLKMEFPITEMIPININEITHIDTVMRLNAAIPVEFDIAQTPLANYFRQAKVDIAELKKQLGSQ